jgi:hypothetical protein
MKTFTKRKFNPAKTFHYEVLGNGKRVGRSYFIRSILCGKGGRLCSNRKSTASKFHTGRDKSYCRPSVITSKFLKEFEDFFKGV